MVERKLKWKLVKVPVPIVAYSGNLSVFRVLRKRLSIWCLSLPILEELLFVVRTKGGRKRLKVALEELDGSPTGGEPDPSDLAQATRLFEEQEEIVKRSHILFFIQEEQEEIVKRRPYSDAGLNFDEIRQMKYLSKVLDETLRVNSLIPIFRVAKATVNLNGYTIPKGWKFLTFLWSFNMDPETYVNPMEFNPSRWDDMETKPTSYFPFGVGPKMCPGSNVARLSLSIILQYFLLNYRFEQPDPDQSKTKPLDNCIGRFKKIST
ncbi:beta-amyrin 11-oxidase-like [Lycium ferocissimum]|uniref:beta-amyrin 11-oxidase-like n=1 Tax=Lycium ferocissimum TaxID=112874 RepID=UPI002815090E|nr:beta-amyrin 11-oxidase-like [Lycium ferocissimum]